MALAELVDNNHLVAVIDHNHPSVIRHALNALNANSLI
jgi:hypothetical protein